jgi:hypothetical protein
MKDSQQNDVFAKVLRKMLHAEVALYFQISALTEISKPGKLHIELAEIWFNRE